MKTVRFIRRLSSVAANRWLFCQLDIRQTQPDPEFTVRTGDNGYPRTTVS
jgi:hypothetical protein